MKKRLRDRRNYLENKRYIAIMAVITVGIFSGTLYCHKSLARHTNTSTLEYSNPTVYQTKDSKTTNTAITQNLNGKWERTNVYKYHQGSLEITNCDKKGFDFAISVINQGNTGDVNGHASLDKLGKETAKIATDFEETEFATFTFQVVNDNLVVKTKNAEYLGGHGTYFDGTYTKGKVTYLNANIVNEILKSHKKVVKKLLGKDYQDFTFIMEYGQEYESKLTYSCFVSGVGEGADLLIKKNNKIYCLLYGVHNGGYDFYTTDPKYKKKIPKIFGELREGVSIKYHYKKV